MQTSALQTALNQTAVRCELGETLRSAVPGVRPSRGPRLNGCAAVRCGAMRIDDGHSKIILVL